MNRPPLRSILVLSGTALAYEILLTRLFSIVQWHHFAYMIISLALLGYGFSGTVLSLAQTRLLPRYPRVYVLSAALFGFSSIGAYLIAQRLPFNPEEIAWDPQQPLLLFVIYLLLSLPFFFAAGALALTLAAHRGQVGRIYATDLLGAGLGSLGIIGLLHLVFPVTALAILGTAGMLSGALAAWELGMPRRRIAALSLAALAPLALLATPWAELTPSPYKEQSQLLRIDGTSIVAQRSSPLGLVSVVESKTLPLRHAPGLSLLAGTEPPPQLAAFTDGDGLSAITRYTGERAPLAYLDQLTTALPYHLKTPGEALILGAGGGSDVLQAKYFGVADIHAVELNPQLVDLIKNPFGAFAGRLYDDPAVHVHVAEARGFVADSRGQFDLIQIALLDSYSAASAGLYALSENYLYTVEALEDYLTHLRPDGYLAITRWVKLPPRDTLKLFATALTALKRLGVSQPEQRLVLIRSWQTATLLIKNGPFDNEELQTVQRFCDNRLFDTAYYPGIGPADVNRHNRLREAYFYRGATALLGSDADEFLRHYKFNLTPATDDQPYFFHFFEWSTLAEIFALRGQGGLPLLEWGYLILVATLVQAVLASVILILLPLALFRRAKQDTPPRATQVLIYFFAIGLAFMFLEIAFIQRFILFLHHPLYAVAAVLTAFLIFAGLGSAWTRRERASARPGTTVKWAIIGLAAISVPYVLGLPVLFASLASLEIAARIAVSVALIAPLAFLMGMPFPLALSELGKQAPHWMPWAWGVNGCASVIGAVLATLCAVHAGFTAVIFAALVFYFVAAGSFPSQPNR